MLSLIGDDGKRESLFSTLLGMKDLLVKQALNTPLTYGSRLLLHRKHGHSALLRRNAKSDYVVMSGHCSCPLLEQKSDEILFLAASRRDHVRGYCTTKLMDPPAETTCACTTRLL